jgi:hypothetical protein
MWEVSYSGKTASHNRRVELHGAFVPWCECNIKVDYPSYCSGCYVKFLHEIRKEYLQVYKRFQPYYRINLVEIAKPIDNFTF